MRVVTGVLLGAVGLALSLVVAGVVYQRRGWRRDRKLMAPGEMVEIGGGRRVYVLRKGQGAPAVVFEAGFAAMHMNWRKVQEAVAARADAEAPRCRNLFGEYLGRVYRQGKQRPLYLVDEIVAHPRDEPED